MPFHPIMIYWRAFFYGRHSVSVAREIKLWRLITVTTTIFSMLVCTFCGISRGKNLNSLTRYTKYKQYTHIGSAVQTHIHTHTQSYAWHMPNWIAANNNFHICKYLPYQFWIISPNGLIVLNAMTDSINWRNYFHHLNVTSHSYWFGYLIHWVNELVFHWTMNALARANCQCQWFLYLFSFMNWNEIIIFIMITHLQKKWIHFDQI